MMFENRSVAGKLLSEQLAPFRGADAVVLALPRGGVPVALEVARSLSLPLDIIAVRKLGAPADPEYAIGAINERGTVLLNETETGSLERAALEELMAKEEAEAKRRSALYRSGRPPLPLAGKTAILVDDGMATGLSMRLAALTAKEAGAKAVVAAVPVASSQAIRQLKRTGAEVVVLVPPEEFAGAVGAHYLAFEQLKDAEVIRMLKQV